MYFGWFYCHANLLCDSDCPLDHPRPNEYRLSKSGALAFVWLSLVVSYSVILGSLSTNFCQSQASRTSERRRYFFQHKGVRVEDIQKAWEKNQLNKSRAGNRSKTALRGGSTITQQLAKNLFLSSEQNYLRKGQELLITGLLEMILSKQRLLEIYLNSVEWGEGIFGIGAASMYYYKISPALLDREQAAALASALPAPKCFDKSQYCRKANIHFPTRQDFILENMDRVALMPLKK